MSDESLSLGFRSAQLVRGIESPSRFIAIVQWESVDAHVKNFIETERYTSAAEIIMPFLLAPPVVEHFQ